MTILRKLARLFRYFNAKRRFGSFGWGSAMKKPILLHGAKYMHFGRAVQVRDAARFEAVDRWKDQSFLPRLEIGDNTSFEQGMHLTFAGLLRIGEGTAFSAYCCLTDIDHDYSNPSVPILDQPIVVTDTVIGDHCLVGIGAIILAGTKLGSGCIVGANSVVRGEFPPGCVIVGAPGRVVKRYNYETKCWDKV